VAGEVALFADSQREFGITEVTLGEVQEPYGATVTEGQPIRIYGRNIGSSTLRDLSVGVEGDAADKIQLAVNLEDAPGVWAAEGQPIYVAEYIGKDEDFDFWARAVFNMEDRAGSYTFDFRFSGVAIG
jgi:hypothetical protein